MMSRNVRSGRGTKGLYRVTYLVRQCNMDPSKSVRLAVWLDELMPGCSSGSNVWEKPWGHLGCRGRVHGACGHGLLQSGVAECIQEPKRRFVGCGVLVNNGDPSSACPRDAPVDGRCTSGFGLEQLAIQPLECSDLARQEEAVSVHAAFFFLQGDCRALTPQRVRSRCLAAQH